MKLFFFISFDFVLSVSVISILLYKYYNILLYYFYIRRNQQLYFTKT